MTNGRKIIILPAVLFLAVFSGLMSLPDSRAASGTASMYTDPGGSQKVNAGDVFSVSTRISSGDNVPVTGAVVYLSYPAEKLQLQSIDYNGSPYNIQLIESNNSGVLRMERAAFPMISGGNRLFVTATFKATTPGRADLNFTEDSRVTSGEDDSNILTSRAGVTYEILDPLPTGPAAGSSNSGDESDASVPGTTTSKVPQSGSNGGLSSPAAPGQQSRPDTSASMPEAQSLTASPQAAALNLPDQPNKKEINILGYVYASLAAISAAIASIFVLKRKLLSKLQLSRISMKSAAKTGDLSIDVQPAQRNNSPVSSASDITLEERLERLPDAPVASPGTTIVPRDRDLSGRL